jgi:hypothetical protein
MGAVGAAQAQKTMGQYAAFEKSIKLLFDEIGQARPSLKLDLGQEGLEMFLYQPVEGGLFGTPPLVVYAPSCRRRLNRCVHRP